MSIIKTGFLMLLLSALLLAVGVMVGREGGLVVALVIAFVMNFGMYFFGEKIALAMAQARPLPRSEAPWLYEAMEKFCRRAGIPPIPLYFSPDPQPNAFACGRGPGASAICVNAGLLNSMSQREVVGVLAHEIAHVKNRDTLIMTIAAAIGTAIMFLSRMALFFGGDDERPNPIAAIAIMILGPLAALLIQMAVSRAREYAADALGAKLMGDPHPLADALETLGATVARIQPRTAHPETAHMYIANPFSSGGLVQLFSTHPPLQERVRKLRTNQYLREL